jgi:hypothetical protein
MTGRTLMDIAAIGRQFGLDEAQTRAALDALAPVVAAGVRRTAQSPEGLQDVFSSVLTGGHDRALEDEQAVTFDNAKSTGDDILGQIFGNKDVSREVAERVSTTSGVGSDILKQLLPVIATVVMGQLAKQLGPANAQAGGSGGVGDLQRQGAPSGGLGDILGDVFGGGQQPQISQQSAPTQGQGSGGSLQDILTQILGGGGNQGQTAPDQMGNILRDIFDGQAPGAPGGSADSPRFQPSEQTVTRGREALDGLLGGGTNAGSAADDLLNSVDRAVRGLR